MPCRLIYLHGFASGPGSNKAVRFAAALGKRGVPLEIPDLNEGDFTGLTLTRQLRLLERLTQNHPPGSTVLIGSSMGAYVAALYASRSDIVSALVLMAPAFDFGARWSQRLSATALAEWQRRGQMPVLHHATGELMPIGWSLVQDARLHPPFPRVRQPSLLFHGRRDESVDYRSSVRWAEDNPGEVILQLLESDHSLAEDVDRILEQTFAFLAPWFPQLVQAQTP